MANNELSGPSVAIYLAKWISTLKNNYSYRFVFLPETIGSIYYISKNKDHLKKKKKKKKKKKIIFLQVLI